MVRCIMIEALRYPLLALSGNIQVTPINVRFWGGSGHCACAAIAFNPSGNGPASRGGNLFRSAGLSR